MKCHSERSEESCSALSGPPKKAQGEIPRFARNDSQFQSSEDVMSFWLSTGHENGGVIPLLSKGGGRGWLPDPATTPGTSSTRREPR